MNEVILIIICAQSILCFFIGAKVGQMTTRGEDIKIPNVNPVKKINEWRNSKEYEEEVQKINLMYENIDNYDGTSLGQKDIE